MNIPTASQDSIQTKNCYETWKMLIFLLLKQKFRLWRKQQGPKLGKILSRVKIFIYFIYRVFQKTWNLAMYLLLFIVRTGPDRLKDWINSKSIKLIFNIFVYIKDFFPYNFYNKFPSRYTIFWDALYFLFKLSARPVQTLTQKILIIYWNKFLF